MENLEKNNWKWQRLLKLPVHGEHKMLKKIGGILNSNMYLKMGQQSIWSHIQLKYFDCNIFMLSKIEI